MSTDQSTNLGLPFLMPAQAQKHVTVNESLTRLDALVQTAVESRSVSTQPGSPADGAVWIAPAGKTGPEWGGYADWALTYYRDGAWEQIAPKEGWRAWVKDEDVFVHWTGSAWTEGAVATTIELGHASDTTISRSAAGVIAVEGGVIPKENRENVFTARQSIVTSSHAGDGPEAADLTLETTDAGASGPTLTTFHNSASPAANDVLTRWHNVGRDSAGNLQSYCLLRAVVLDPTTASEDSKYEFWTTVAASLGLRFNIGHGLYANGVTGGDKGDGTGNFKAVYDDNALLSCYVFDAVLDGHVDLEKWDGKVPDRVYPALWDDVQTGVRTVEVDGRTVEEPVFERVKVAEAQIETRQHDGARRFVEQLGTGRDPLTLDGYAAHWKEKRHLTSLPDEATFDPEQGLPTGDWIQRLVETVEIQAVLIEQLNQRLKAIEAVARATP